MEQDSQKIIPNGTPVSIKSIQGGHYAEVVSHYENNGRIEYEVEIHSYFGETTRGCGWKRSDLTEN